jgi:hypothetical protein
MLDGKLLGTIDDAPDCWLLGTFDGCLLGIFDGCLLGIFYGRSVGIFNGISIGKPGCSMLDTRLACIFDGSS